MLLRSSVLLIGVVCLLLLVEGTACSSNDDDDYSSLSCSIQPPGEAQGHLAGCGGVAEDEVEEESAVSAKKYYLVNQCSGRFGNQMEYLAGEWAIARHLGRILVLPPFNDYGSGNSKRFPFERVFDVDSTRASIRLAQQHHCEQQRQQQLDDTCDDGAGDIVSAEEFFLDPNVIAWFEDDERESKVVEDDVTAFDPYGNNNENNNRNSDDLQTSDDADADTAGSVRVGKRLYAFVRSDTAKPNSYFATWDTYFNITSWKEMTSKSKVGSLRSKAPLRIDPSFDDEDTVLAIDCPVSSYPPSPTETSAFYGHLSFTNQIHTIVDKFLARKLTAIRQAATDATDDASSSPVKYVGIQLRRDSDMQKVCKKYSYEREWWGSHYCGHPTTMGMCWPSVDYILSKVEEVMNKHGAVAAFLATDGECVPLTALRVGYVVTVFKRDHRRSSFFSD
eukprot:TRINITY_DN2826_c0_g1_i3.p1 TRINITY_DN2826_c0_g1~~TRINITY_DN2826_c0_g1_i3.p1  ORF type:complete len:448 (-),score=85.23 TRINITY_DN2826_c0_g1_i3:2-1345(-)